MLNLKNIIYLIAFLLPLYLFRFSILGIPTNILEILIAGAFIIFFFKERKNSIQKFWSDYKIYILGSLLILIGLSISAFLNDNSRAGIGIIKGWFIFPMIYAFLILKNIKSEDEIEKIIKAYYFSALAVSLIGLYYYLSGNLTFDGRLSVFYLSPNHLAMFLAPAVFVGIYLIKAYGLRLTAYGHSLEFNIYYSLLIFSLTLMILNIYLTYSYAAWAAIITAWIIIFSVQKKWRIALMAILILILAVFTQIYNPKFNALNDQRSSFESRITIWKSAAKILKDNPVVGIGPGNFQAEYLEYQKYFPPYLEWAVPQPHNLYLAFWLGSGIPGLIGFLLIIFHWIKNILPAAKKDSQYNLAAALLSIMMYVLLHGLVDTPYWKNDLALSFWLILALGIIANKKTAVSRQQ